MEKTKLKLVQIRLHDEDLETLKLAYPSAGYNAIVRALVARHAKQIRVKVQEKLAAEELREV